MRKLRLIQSVACSSNKQAKNQNNIIFIASKLLFFAKSVAFPTSTSNSSGGRANSANITAHPQHCSLVCCFLVLGLVNTLLIHANTKGFVLASLSGAHCGNMPPQLKTKHHIFSKKNPISVACPTSSSRGRENSAKIMADLKRGFLESKRPKLKF